MMAAPAVKRTSLKDLAAHLELSQTTVSFVLNNAPLARNLTEATRQRVLAAAREFNYRPSYFAVNLNKSGSDSVGVLVPEHSEGFFTVVMDGAERYLLSKHFLYFTACHYWKPKLIEEYAQLLVKRGAEGLLLLNTNADFDSIVPVVTVAGRMEKEGVTNVAIDHMAAARMTIEHLYENGHRKIAYMKGHRRVIDAESRWEALMQVARDFGVQPTAQRMIQMSTSAWSPEVGYAPAKQLTQGTRDFTALVCFNDTAAIGAIRALHDDGLRVPQDVSVIGFDDIVGAKFHVPSLTTIRQPLAMMGRLASKILLDRIAHPNKKYAPTIMVQPKLIVRESTARVKTSRKAQPPSRPPGQVSSGG